MSIIQVTVRTKGENFAYIPMLNMRADQKALLEKQILASLEKPLTRKTARKLVRDLLAPFLVYIAKGEPVSVFPHPIKRFSQALEPLVEEVTGFSREAVRSRPFFQIFVAREVPLNFSRSVDANLKRRKSPFEVLFLTKPLSRLSILSKRAFHLRRKARKAERELRDLKKAAKEAREKAREQKVSD